MFPYGNCRRITVKVVRAEAARSIYALKVLRSYGLQGANLWRVCRATTISYLTHAAPAWWGYTDACSRLSLQSVFNRLRRFGLLPPEFPTHEELCEHPCGELFKQVLHNRIHVLCQLLPPVKETPYGLRPSSHNRIIPSADNRFRRNFIVCMLYKYGLTGCGAVEACCVFECTGAANYTKGCFVLIFT